MSYSRRALPMFPGSLTFAQLRLPGAALFVILLLTTIYHQPVWESVPHSSFVASTRSGSLIDDVRNRTLGFQKIFVVALPDRYDRQDLWSLAAKYSNIDFEYVRGVKGEDIPAKAIPVGWDMKSLETEPGTLGCYRSELNVMRKMVDDRIETALLLEDDADWDVMLKSQLTEFARGSQFVQQGDFRTSAKSSPYGDDWDLLWFGHCGIRNDEWNDSLYYAIDNDPTVVAFDSRSHEMKTRKPNTKPLGLQGNFTRLVFQAGPGLCTYAYAISLRGAERFLYQYSIKPQAPVFDKAMSRFCGGHLSGAKCYTSYPNLFDQYKQAGDISKDSDRRKGGKGGYREKAETWNIAFPVKAGLGSFIENSTFKSQYPDATMLSEIDPEHLQFPIGRGLAVTKAEFEVEESLGT